MDLFSEMITAVQNDLTVGPETTLFDPTSIKLALNRSYRKAGGLFKWPDLEDAKKTSTIANQEYYDYPQTWKPESIWKLKVDGIDYGTPLLFKDYQYEKENDNPSGLKYMWANQWRRFFIDPTPTANGNNNIEIFGIETVELLVDDGDTTIFSYSMPECNEALVLEAVAILKAKGDESPVMLTRYIQGSYLLSIEAKQILQNAFGKIQQERSKIQKTIPYFDVPDFFAPKRSVKSKIGDF